MGEAAAATRSPNARASASGSSPRDSHSPAASSSPAEERLGLRRPPRGGRGRADAGADGPAVGVQGAGERGDGDDHGVAGADLAELLRAGRRRHQDGGDELVGLQGVALHAGVELRGRDQPGAAGGGRHLDHRPGGQQRRVRVTGRGRRAEVAAHGAPDPDLRGAHGARGHRQPGQLRAELVDHPRVGHAGAEPDPPVVGAPLPQLGHPAEVEQRTGPAPVEVEVDHDVGAAGDRQGIGAFRPQRQRLRPRRRLQEIHARSSLSPVDVPGRQQGAEGAGKGAAAPGTGS